MDYIKGYIRPKIVGFFLGGVLFVCLYICLQMIPPGYVGVVVNLLGDEKGVIPNELHVGLHWISPWKTVYTFPVFEQNETWEEKKGFNFQTAEGMSVHADVGVTFHLKPNFIPIIFQKYRRGMSDITDIFLRNYIRDAINKSASHMKIEDLYGDKKEIFFESIEKEVREKLKEIGIEISRIYLIGRFHFPDNVITALNSKIEANQRAQQRENELREAEAEAKKQVAAAEGKARSILLQAKAEAESNTLISKSITEELIKWQTAQKWNGVLPTVTSGVMPFINVDKKDK